MGKGKKKRKGGGGVTLAEGGPPGKKSSKAKLPKKKCCDSRPRCGRCPLRMLKEGTLPAGYAVHKRKLVKVDPKSAPAGGKSSVASPAA